MKKLFFLSALLCASLMSWAYTTEPDTWIGGGGENDKFKWYTITDVNAPADVINIQKPGWSEEIGIYTHKSGYNKVTFNGVVKTNGTHYHQDGAGVILFLSALTEKNTDVLFYDGDNVVWGLRIYNDNGESTSGKTASALTINSNAETLDATVPETFDISTTTAAGYNGTITFKSNNSNVASVTDGGRVTAVGRGTAKITVTAPATETYSSSSQILTVTVTGPINWAAIEWLGDGAGGGTYSNKYKLAAADGQGVVNIQNKEVESVNHPGIYTTFPAVVTSCSLGAGNYATQDAGMWLFLSAFTKMETDVTVTCGTTDYNFTVYYVGGTTAIDNTNANVNAIKVIENGQLIIIKNGVRYNALGAEVH